MSRPYLLLVLLLASGVVTEACHAGSGHDLGASESTAMRASPRDDCSAAELTYNYDGSIENGYCWDMGGVSPPYYGAFAEAYDLGPGCVVCAAYWFTQVGYFSGNAMDAYVWDGGVTGEPGSVLCLVPGFVPENIPYWPECGQNDIAIACPVSAQFTVGWWADWSPEFQCEWYICSDESGPVRHPWTCVQPGVGYPSSWQHAYEVFPGCSSMAIGVYFSSEPSPVESRSWGAIKFLFE